MKIQPRNRILAAFLVVMVLATLSIAVTVSADHLEGASHSISYHEAMVSMGEYDQPISYSDMPLHGSVWWNY